MFISLFNQEPRIKLKKAGSISFLLTPYYISPYSPYSSYSLLHLLLTTFFLSSLSCSISQCIPRSRIALLSCICCEENSPLRRKTNFIHKKNMHIAIINVEKSNSFTIFYYLCTENAAFAHPLTFACAKVVHFFEITTN